MHGPVVLAFGKWSSYVVAAAFLVMTGFAGWKNPEY